MAWHQTGHKPKGVGRPRKWSSDQEGWRERQRRHRQNVTEIRELEGLK